ncbi:canalicular multispecific organic anion transporter 1 [Selaginella moellendorffii]|uniref:canalicular multispecific organic anion transporter 1 n=1 Tax=Selaginella moellendorffii TaxID=88036 RepID=UPI000D1CEB15|nr:canalicular multispecific organic anion transporter 1 [Selaginella moellendorffii]|eukprot:XP_024538492.1 canalicular multispecific organic anion transporter 1 [Selaginella moellendorffii]
MQIQRGILAGLIGKVGSGKSSLLYGILEELKLTQGSLFVEGNIAYSPQQPWILNDTMRNNIVFGSIFDNKRYDNVVAACALNHDISMLPNGSDTEIGERGVNLSGGQKARVSLARACYSTAPIILLDDPLSAVDASTAKYIVDYVLNGILKGRTVIMATHSIISLQACDEIYLLDTNNGIKRILSSSKDIKCEMELVSAKTELNASQYIAAFLVVFLRNYISPGLTGVILVQTLKLTDVLQIAIKWTVEAESVFVSVERILEYCHLSTEATNKSEPRILSSNWPAAGSIEFINYTLAYREDLPAVLNNISFKIFPLEKIGIVGRTGAGKSSLAAAMFRMVENMACSGTILVDDIDIKTIELDDLRQRLSIIPQDPVLFSGTLRFNMDPFGKNDDREIHEALTRAHFSSTQSYKNFDNGLDGQITSSGTNFSVGERQLLCLARSLLRKSKILIMDEATAAVDNDTDQIIQATIRASFQDCTVLTVAHRIQTIIDNDRVLVMEAGRIAEFDTPKNLLKLTDGLFFNMVAQQAHRTGILAISGSDVSAGKTAELNLFILEVPLCSSSFFLFLFLNYSSFMTEVYKPPALLEDGIKLFVYAGKYDLICNWLLCTTVESSSPSSSFDSPALCLAHCFGDKEDRGERDEPKLVLKVDVESGKVPLLAAIQVVWRRHVISCDFGETNAQDIVFDGQPLFITL